MKTIRLTMDELKDYVNMLQNVKIPYFVYKTTYSVIIESKIGKIIFSNSYVPYKELYFVRQVKEYIIKNDLHKKIKLTKDLTIKDIDYFGFRKGVRNKTFKDIIEIDINNAYWKSANVLGLLSKDIYEKGKRMKKKTRLVALGSLAKSVDVYKFSRKKLKFIKPIKSDTEKLWVEICAVIDDLMGEIKKDCGEDFIFYWVDAIFVKVSAVNKVKQILKKHGYSYKTNKITKIKCKYNKAIVYTKGEYPREFFYRSGELLFDDL